MNGIPVLSFGSSHILLALLSNRLRLCVSILRSSIQPDIERPLSLDNE